MGLPECAVAAHSSPMDKIDREILGILLKEGRISLRELGERVHLSANTVGERVRKLQDRGVIRAFEARPDLALLGLAFRAQVEVKLGPATRAEQFEAAIRRIPGIVDACLMTGAQDYVLRIACRDQADLVRIIETLRAEAGVVNTHSSVILREIPVGPLPI
jgi:Lrp/AsnC family leucine-responsive transcriptional regulator